VSYRSTARVLAASLLLGVVPVVSGQPAPAKKLVSPAVPFACFTSAWDASFKVVGTRYDKAAHRVTWTLEAKKDAPFPAYEAFVVDPDGVEVDTMKVKIAPTEKVKKGAKLQAELSLGFTAGEPAKITIRARR
jgi:hypothetical protein